MDNEEAWKVKFQFLIQRLGDLISQEGKKMALINIEAERNPQKQFEKYVGAVELVRNQMECVVSTSLPGEERIFWPYHDVQFYIRDGKDAISSTGNASVIQQVFNTKTQEINMFIPGLDYWKNKNFFHQLDTTDYIDEQKLSAGEISLDSHVLIEKYKHFHTVPFENEEWWHVLKFFFIASEFNNLDGFGQLLGGIPKELKVKCECGHLIDVELYWKGLFKIPEQEFEHQYYLYISHECESCGKRTCVYRPRGPYCPHLLVFMSHLAPQKKFKMTDIEMVSMWQDTFKRGAIKDMEQFQKVYSKDILKFGSYIMEMSDK